MNNKKIRKDILLPFELVNRILDYSKFMGLNFTSSCIILLNQALEVKNKG